MKQIELEFEGETLKGILIKEDKTHLTLKLKSGYNANLEKSKVKILKEEELKEKTPKKEEKKQNKNLPKIVILHTGGTIASKVDYATGAVSSKFKPEELLAMYPELQDKVQISAKMIGNFFSEDMRFGHYNLMLENIEATLKENPIGVIISHGTDTLHYTSSALQYACENLPVPVILVGAQRSSDRPSSDAYSNIDAVVDFLIENSKLKKSYRRVGALMHKTISDTSFDLFDGINLKKMHSTRRDAFKQINYESFAVVNDGIIINRSDLLSEKPKEKFSYTKYNENLKIGYLKSHPNLFPEEISACGIYDAVIIEGTGLGHLGVNEVDEKTKIHKKNLEELKKLANKIPVVVGVQTVYGQVDLNVYSTGRYILEAGVKGNYMNLTTETLFMRAAYLLSKDAKNFDKLWEENLEGFEIRSIEISEE